MNVSLQEKIFQSIEDEDLCLIGIILTQTAYRERWRAAYSWKKNKITLSIFITRQGDITLMFDQTVGLPFPDKLRILRRLEETLQNHPSFRLPLLYGEMKLEVQIK